MPSAAERCQQILELSSNSDALTTITEGLDDPVTCSAAMIALQEMGTPASMETLIKFLQNGQRTTDEAQQLVKGVAEVRYYKKLIGYCEEFPLCAFLALAQAATPSEYAEFQKWRTRLPKPLITVFNIDDEPGGRSLWQLIINRSGDMLVVGKASDAPQGIPMVGQLQPDVVLVDLMMPYMLGTEAMPHLRQVAPHAKLVLRTYHYQDEALRAEVLALGGDALMPYGPVNPDDVVSGIHLAYAQESRR